MTEGNFVDYIKVHIASGKGGQGSTHLRREKFVPKGGDPMEEMVVEAVISFFKATKTFGPYFT